MKKKERKLGSSLLRGHPRATDISPLFIISFPEASFHAVSNLKEMRLFLRCVLSESNSHISLGISSSFQAVDEICVWGRTITGKGVAGSERNVKCHKPLKAELPFLLSVQSVE